MTSDKEKLLAPATGKYTCSSRRARWQFLIALIIYMFLEINYNFILCIFVVVAFIWFYPVL